MQYEKHFSWKKKKNDSQNAAKKLFPDAFQNN